tara:strand:- start:13808 stop:15043 length:1236 start_codon:yes stop_codon:yes gene_type:complete
MKILFIHQNFPGQFKFLAPALVQAGHIAHTLTLRDLKKSDWNGVNISRYDIKRSSTEAIHPWLSDFESSVIRGEACFNAAKKLKKSGFIPDVIVAHPGWGEGLFLKEVWPRAKLGLYCEFFYGARGLDVGFDPEFASSEADDPCRIQMKNLNTLFHINQADSGLSPTKWQASTFPEQFRDRITISHDGIDTNKVIPNPEALVTINDSIKITAKDQVVTFVVRNIEPLRGAHIFLRALPKILKERPKARIIIVGEDKGRGYGLERPGGGTWKDLFVAEVRSQLSDAEWERIHFVGRIPYQYFIDLLQVSSVHVYLTYPFVLSWSLLEAMSAGCTIVASSTGPVIEAIRDGETGRLFDFFDVDELAKLVCELLGDAKQSALLGEGARSFAIDNYDLQNICLPRQIAWIEGLAN